MYSHFLSVCLCLPLDCEKLDYEEGSMSNSSLCASLCAALAHGALCWTRLLTILDLRGHDLLLDVAADPPGRLPSTNHKLEGHPREMSLFLASFMTGPRCQGVPPPCLPGSNPTPGSYHGHASPHFPTPSSATNASPHIVLKSVPFALP